MHCTANSIYGFPEMKLRGLVPNSYIHVSVGDLHISRVGLHICLQQNRQTNPGNIYIAHRYMNVETGIQNIIILFWKYWGCPVSFLGIHKSETDIYIEFSPALHLQCGYMCDLFRVLYTCATNSELPSFGVQLERLKQERYCRDSK
jgi:hypothetical protein